MYYSLFNDEKYRRLFQNNRHLKIAGFIQKPFTMTELSKGIREILDHEKEAGKRRN